MFNLKTGLIDIDVSPYLKDVPLAGETDTEVEAEVETDEVETAEMIIDDKKVADDSWAPEIMGVASTVDAVEYLMAAQARLLTEFGDRLSYVLDDNGHISNIDVSLVKSKEAA